MNRLLIALLPLVTACSSVPDVTSYLQPYKVDVRQGNMVTQEMVAQLKPGQTKDQVRFILGTPLIVDMFHSDRWDYIYRFQPGRGGEVQQRRLVVYFVDGQLAKVGGDVAAAESDNAPAPKAAIREIDIGAPAAKPEEKKVEEPAPQPESAN